MKSWKAARVARFLGEWIKNEAEKWILERHQDTNIEKLLEARESQKPLAEYANALLTPPTIEPLDLGLFTADPDFLNRLREYGQADGQVIPFDVETLNQAVRGVRRKTVNIILAGTNVGKTLGLCHLAAGYLRKGLNVVYLTMEMTDWLIAARIYANLLEIDLEPDSRLIIPKHRTLPERYGKLVVKSFPKLVSHAGRFRSFLAELKSKRQFVPTIIFIDYIALCGSEQHKLSPSTPQYIMLSEVSKELGSLAAQTDTVIWTAAQSNRAGLEKAEPPTVANTAGSLDIACDADIILSLAVDPKNRDRYLCAVAKHQSGASSGQICQLAVNRKQMRIMDITDAEIKEDEAVRKAYSTLKNTRVNGSTALLEM